MAQLCKFASLSTLVLLFLPHVSRALDPLFQACEPKKCGDLIISYPFYIEGQQQSFCGYPGYRVTCNTNNYMNFIQSTDTYAISEVSYINHTLVVVNTVILQTTFNCSPAFHNFTLDDRRLQFASNHSEVLFLHNCSTEGQRSIAQYTQFSCRPGGEHEQVLAAYADDTDLRSLAGQWGYVVLVPYEGQGGSDLANVVKKGIQLRWTATTCSTECIQSGGRSMHNQTSQQAQCVCPNGPWVSCQHNESLFVLAYTHSELYSCS